MIVHSASRLVTLTVLAVSIALLALTPPASAAPQSVSSTELIEHAAAYDGQEIIYTGEAIGDVMIRGTYAWVNVSDGANAVGLWLTAEQAKGITVLGSYKYSGDRVTVTGVFHRACAEHGGDFDIHVSDIVIATPGAATPHPIVTSRLVLTVLLTALAVMLYLADRRRGRVDETQRRKAE